MSTYPVLDPVPKNNFSVKNTDLSCVGGSDHIDYTILDHTICAKGSSTKYDHFTRVSTGENEKNEKNSIITLVRDHSQNTTTLRKFLWEKMKKVKNFYH